MTGEAALDEPQDPIEELDLRLGIGSTAGEDHPIGPARLDQLGPGVAQVLEQMPAGAAVTGWKASPRALVHGSVVKRHDLRVQRAVELRLKDRQPVEYQTEIEQAPWLERRQHLLKCARDIYQVQKGVRNQKVPGGLSAGNFQEIKHINLCELGCNRRATAGDPYAAWLGCRGISRCFCPTGEAARCFHDVLLGKVDPQVVCRAQQFSLNHPLQHRSDPAADFQYAWPGHGRDGVDKLGPNSRIQRPIVDGFLHP